MVRLAPIQRAEFRIYAQKFDQQVRRHLMMEIGEPCLMLWRRTWVGEQVARRCSYGTRRRVFILRAICLGSYGLARCDHGLGSDKKYEPIACSTGMNRRHAKTIGK